MNLRPSRYERDELGVPSDFRFMDRMTLFQDPELVALVCPRFLEIQAGAKDNPSHVDGGRMLAPRATEYYDKLGVKDRFRFVVFEGGHEFNDASAWEFLRKNL